VRELEIRPGQIGELLLLVRVYSILRGAGRGGAGRQENWTSLTLLWLTSPIIYLTSLTQSLAKILQSQNPPIHLRQRKEQRLRQ